jgi:hypothetical protein
MAGTLSTIVIIALFNTMLLEGTMAIAIRVECKNSLIVFTLSMAVVSTLDFVYSDFTICVCSEESQYFVTDVILGWYMSQNAGHRISILSRTECAEFLQYP